MLVKGLHFYDWSYKSVPLHAKKSTGGKEGYSSYSFSTSALDGGEWSASRSGRAISPGKGPWYPLERRLGGPQSRTGQRGQRKNPFDSAGDRTSIAGSSSP
jgi:hypothetical protein